MKSLLPKIKQFINVNNTYEISYVVNKKQVKFNVKVKAIKLKRPAWDNHHYNIILEVLPSFTDSSIRYMNFQLPLPSNDKDQFEIIDHGNYFIVRVFQMRWTKWTWKLREQ